MLLKQIEKEKLLFNNNGTNPLPLESDRRKRTPMESMLRGVLDNTAALLPSSADLDFPSRWEGQHERDLLWDERYRSLFYHTACPEMVWLNWAEIGRTGSELHGKQWCIVSKTCTLRVCVCESVISQQSQSFRYRMGKWGGACKLSHPSPAVGGACCCAAERDLYIKGDGWVSCSLTKISRRLIGGVGAQTIPENSVSTKQCHVTTQGGLFSVHCSVWPISFVKTL